MKKVVIGIVVVAIIALVVGFVPLMEIPYTVQYEDTEIFYEDEPYEATETYTATVPLSYEATSYVGDSAVVEHYETIIPGLPPMSGEKEIPIKVAYVNVRNTDVTAGSFTVHFSGITPLWGHTPGLTTELYLSPGEEGTASCPSEYNIDDWSYEVTPSTKEVEKERTVTKYRQVEKERPVIRFETRYKKVPIFEYLLSRF